MNFRIKLFFLTVILTLFSVLPFHAQETMDYTSGKSQYQKALQLFDKEKYTAAQELFTEALDDFSEDTELRANAEYYIAICAIELFHEDAEYLISRFIEKHPESSKVDQAYFNMGRYQYRQERYSKVIFWFEKINTEKLEEEQLPEYYFKKGYSHYKTEDPEKASQVLYEIKDENTRYSAPALYYYSHIAYEDENYQTALEGFQQLKQNSTFAPIMPYYITQIFYLQQRYEKVINYAPQYVHSATAKRLPEIAKIIGDSYFQLQQYDSSMTYLDLHKEKANTLTREDYYQLGFVAYKLDKYEKAIENFEKVTDKEDELAQNAYYHLADCYLSMDKKNRAKLAFEFAAKLSYDKQIEQNALYNFAKITFQLRNTPFNDAVEAFKKYIDKYPDAENLKEAYGYLVKAYLHSNNYKEALQSLEMIDDKDIQLKQAYQKVAYYRGLELYNNRHYDRSIAVFDRSLQYKDYYKHIAALTYYWKGEALYQLNQFREALNSFNSFILSPGSFGSDVYHKAHYNMGYCNFKLENYPEAIKWFRKFMNMTDQENQEYLADTYIRLGDCYFMRRSHWQAIEYYDKAIEMNLRDQDYGLYQRAIALGLLNRPEKKIGSLKRLTEEYPESDYLDNAYFELGRSYMNMENAQEASSHFTKVTEDYPSSNYVKQALVQLGLIYYNQDQNDKALKYYKRAVAEYPGTEEAKNALTGIKNIYVDRNNVDAYFNYVNGLGDFARVSMSEQDSLTYISAEKLYMKQDCETALEFFRKYLNKFENGNFSVNAHFYMADCLRGKGEKEKALSHLEYVLERPNNAFTEQALSAAATVYHEDGELDKAVEAYQRLEKMAEVHANLIKARTGMMRIYHQREQHGKAIETADKVLHTEKVNSREKREANYIKGISLFHQEEYDRALKTFRLIADEVNSEEGAEAKFRIAQILYEKEDYKVAENEIFDFVQQNSSQEYWKARSFILLAEVYRAMEDNFQAKHTLKSIIDNYEPLSEKDSIIDMAKETYNDIVEEEKYEMKKDSTDQEMKIQFEKSSEIANPADTTQQN